MKYKIGFLTTSYFMADNFKQALEELKDICEITYIELKGENPFSNLPNIYNEQVDNFDGFVCSGLIPYSELIINIEDIKVPLSFLKLDERDFYKYLFKLLNSKREIDFTKSFIDFLREDNNYYDIYSLIDSKNCPYTIRDFNIPQPVYDFKKLNDKLLEIHLDLLKNNKINLSITRNYIINCELNRLGYDCIYMVPSTESILNTFKSVINEITLKNLDKNKSATCIVTINSSEYINDDLIFKNDEIQNQIYNTILNSLSRNGFYGVQVKKNDMKIEIHTTKEMLNNMTKDYTEFFISEDLKEIKYSLNIGWGIGNTNIHAEQNARQANSKSASLGGNCTFIVNDTNNIIGPLYSNKNSNDLEESSIANKVASFIPLSNVNVSKIMSMINDRNSNNVSAEILSDYMNITLRSANRILSILYKAGIATIVNTKLDNQRGRPRKIYKVDFLAFLDNM
ncbi:MULTISPECIES: hypothetical protein [unclassified Clostridioides]|uniref:hypothetical protein n=1 Tax=unclassified Clostridioides TaxID=2635829 RepID=UPI001D0BF616|nr:hypothetical protein [Clostridioides sp. ES-S-0049-03]MCC0655775.1 hypothetical protein [Clostridioides sp. ES-S-0123-01]MCC0676560.1 hypothetical protein [Clostridioides sp. ES-W-0018-02]MCC0680563.1 hypothetical protein [Clostridioides sp. ES-S-0005-03]MCC0694842.1 hypothetical protein [Clostridioides sp. ES-S-0048-02]MCC0706221.1 hypothetical protein [Clostridioides sp. ES-S-0190-01]MCC0711239.1 hypothetical protein [Clostridioides sp. ES-W-0017-02]MCC0763363.1 hypothetical protein [Cl